MRRGVLFTAMAVFIAAAVIAGMNQVRLRAERAQTGGLRSELLASNRQLEELRREESLMLEAKSISDRRSQQASADLSLALDQRNRRVRSFAELSEEANQKLEQAVLTQIFMAEAKELREEEETLTDHRHQIALELSELHGLLALIREENDGRTTKLAYMKEKEEHRLARINFRGRVMARNLDLGFVIVNSGSSDGLTAADSLVVKRGFERVGELRIVEIKPDFTVTNIVPGTLTPGQEVQLYDDVIVQKADSLGRGFKLDEDLASAK